jgi:cytosine/adenosine deaminase-related metal-dependent hydrolase
LLKLRIGGLLRGRDMEYTDNKCIHIDDDGFIESIESASTCIDDYYGSSKLLLIPQPANSHTHLADWVIPEYGTQMDLSDLVAPPHGLKHRYLRKIGFIEKITGYTEALNFLSTTGSGLAIDFREEGVEGCKVAKIAYSRSLFKKYGTLKLLGRPEKLDNFEEEVFNILNTCDGIGLPSPLNYTEEELRVLSNTKKEDTIISSHIAETIETRRKGDLELLLQYIKPSFIVHGTFLTPEDLDTLKKHGIPIAVCPRSVMFHSNGIPPIREFYSHGIQILVGSDNAAWFTPNPWEDAKQVYYIGRSQGLKDPGFEKWVLKGLFINPYEAVQSNPPILDEGSFLHGLLVDGESTNILAAQNKYAGIIKRVDRSAVKAVVIGDAVL